ncbi:cation diffusion facilitator family transporter [Sporichthya polymorpha]|uniref:cation diffusion facilitator family transporter n=1 Tax=Sporichthya polymorpha TaxID=35751 RepID=UPI000375E2D2|nr:cation diffusion facilitator family transporter [Sporichthya polymorpha]
MSHDHDHQASAPKTVLASVLGVTLVVLIAEVVGALWSGSLALLADAGHMLTDAAGLSLALFAAVLMQRPPSDRLTWGYRRAEILAAAAQAAVLLAVASYILVEAVRRMFDPGEIESGVMVVFGVVGLLGNAVAIGLLARARRTHGENLNTRAAMLEVINDALGSVAVLVAAAVIALTGWARADAVVSLLIGVLIVPRTWRILRQAVNILLEATPSDLDMTEVRRHLLELPHVQAVHDLHASTVGTGLPVLTVHLVVDDDCFHDGHLMTLLDEAQDRLAGVFDVEHSTIQFEAASHSAHERHAHA